MVGRSITQNGQGLNLLNAVVIDCMPACSSMDASLLSALLEHELPNINLASWVSQRDVPKK